MPDAVSNLELLSRRIHWSATSGKKSPQNRTRRPRISQVLTRGLSLRPETRSSTSFVARLQFALISLPRGLGWKLKRANSEVKEG